MEDVRAPLPDDPAQGEDRGRVGAERELALQHRQLQHLDAELLGDVLHRFLARGQGARDDDDVVAAPRLLVCELEDVQCGTADVQPCDHVDDREAHAATSGSVGRAAATPRASQKSAASGEPPKSAAPAIAPAITASQPSGT